MAGRRRATDCIACLQRVQQPTYALQVQLHQLIMPENAVLACSDEALDNSL